MIPTDASCPGLSDGNLEIHGGGLGSPPFESYNIVVFDAANNIVFTCNGCSNPIDVVALNGGVGLPSGTYSVLATNILSGCTPPSTLTFIGEGFPPNAFATSNEPCPNTPILLQGSTDAIGFFTTYFWTFPDGTTSNLQNPVGTIEGTYTLIVTVDGCQSLPATVDVQFQQVNVNGSATPDPVCVNGMVTLTANGNADTYTWFNNTTGMVVGVGQNIQALVTAPTIFTVTGETIPEGCTTTDDVLVNVFPSANPQIDVPFINCEGEEFIIDVTGGPFVSYFWSDFSSDPAPRVMNLSSGFYNFAVTVTDLNGCMTETATFFQVVSGPTGSISPALPIICAGESVVLTASGGTDYSWSTGDGGNAITVSPLATEDFTVTVANIDDCEDIVTVTVFVEDPIAAPDVSCGTTTPTSLEFVWDPVTGNYRL